MPTSFLFHRKHPICSADLEKSKPRKRRAYLRYCLQTLPLEKFVPRQIALDLNTHTEEKLHRLAGRLYTMGEKLCQTGEIPPDRWQAICDILTHTDWAQVEESISPYHALLSEKDFYRCSAPSTRKVLRRHAHRFAKRHRLPPESAALLWQGERPAVNRWQCLWLFAPLLPGLGMAIGMFFVMPPIVSLWSLLALPSVLLGGYLISATLLNRFLPSSPLPLLQSGTGHPTLVVGIGKLEEHAKALSGMERILPTEGSDARYLLLLIHSDALLSQCAGEEDMEKNVRAKLKEWEVQYDLTVNLLVIPRIYDSRHKLWRGNPTFAEIVPYLREELQESDQAVCILPTDGIVLPATVERLCAALFHPLCTGEVLSFLYPNESPLPHDRLAKLRRVLLQKMDAPADFNGYGILRADCLGEFTSSTPSERRHRLSGETLYTSSPAPLIDPPHTAPRCTPLLCLIVSVCHPLILWGLIHHALSPLYALLILGLSLSDLWVSMLLSLPRKNRRAVFYTRPSLIRLGKECALRFLLPTHSIGNHLGLSGSVQYLLTFLFGCSVIASGAPLSFLGLFWIFAPILFPAPLLQPSLTPMEKAACHALSKEIAEKLPFDAPTLPPSVIGSEHPSTSPITLGLYGSAIVSALTLGLCDHLTFARRISAYLDQLESLPCKCGLPYADYRMDGAALYENGSIDSYDAAIYALCLCQIESALLEHASTHPSWNELAGRINRLCARMDFHILLTPSGELCQRLTPSEDQVGELRDLCGQGGLTWFAVLSSDSFLSAPTEVSSIERHKSAFSKLNHPKTKLSKEDWAQSRLWDHLLPLLLLPVPKGSPLDFGADLAIRQIPCKKRLSPRQRLRLEIDLLFTHSPTPRQSSGERHFSSLIRWPRLARLLHPAVVEGDFSPQLPLSAPEYCLLLSKKPRYALAHLQILQKSSPTGGFEAKGSTNALSTDALCLGLIAMESAVRATGFAQRIHNHPRCACLLPLFHNHAAPLLSTPLSSPIPSLDPPDTSPVLLGDGHHGLLVSRHGTISLWEKGRPLTVSQEAAHGFAGGRPSGILLSRGNQASGVSYQFASADAPPTDFSVQPEISCRASADTQGNWVWQLRQVPTATDFRLIFCPLCKANHPLRLTTLVNNPRIRLLIEYSSSLTVVLEVCGLVDAFTHADPSPLPKGERQTHTIFDLRSQTATGLLYTPTCIVGGQWQGDTLTIRIGIASTAADALRRMDGEAISQSPPLLAPQGNHTDGLVLAYCLSTLFAGRALPRHTVISHAPLSHCMEQVTKSLCQSGFPIEQTLPNPLTVSRREGVEGLFRRLLTPSPIQGETPLLPMEEDIAYPDGYPHLHRGRNSRPLSHTVSNQWFSLDATPSAIRVHARTFPVDFPLTLILRSPITPWTFPEASTEWRLLPGRICYVGDGFFLTLSLLPDYPVLLVELTAESTAELTVSALNAPHHTAEDCSFWHINDTHSLFLHSWSGEERQVWLIGAFERSNDRLFYEIREAVTPSTYRDLLTAHWEEVYRATQVLQIHEAPSLPAIALTVLSSPSPSKALLSPICTPHSAKDDLLALAREHTLFLPAALLIYLAAFSDASEICQTPIPTPDGSESLYLRAARVLEDAMENAPQTPLLPQLVKGFATLAHRLGDPAHTLYQSFTPSLTTVEPTTGKDPFWHCKRSTLLCLQALENRNGQGIGKLWDTLTAELPLLTAEDGALLWSGVLWTVLGFRLEQQTARFAPMSSFLPCRAQVIWRKSHFIELPAPQTEETAIDVHENSKNHCIVQKNDV